MKDVTLEASLQESAVAVCVKDTARKVLMQNRRCRDICGSRTGQVCETGCMALYAADQSRQWKDWGSHTYCNSFIHDHYYDVTLLCSARYIISFLQALEHKYQAAAAYYEEQGLTRRELEVMALAIRGVSNSRICDRLSISKATLKTHLNHAYAKLREQDQKPSYVPNHRLP
jgi:DNA-binding CsgD family transcriptional regulator